MPKSNPIKRTGFYNDSLEISYGLKILGYKDFHHNKDKVSRL